MVGLTSQVMGKIAALALALGLAACIILTCPLICLTHAATSGAAGVEQTSDDWPAYGGQAAQDHYSSLSQINRENVKELKAGAGLRTYRSQCAVCHGADRADAPPAYPSLTGVYQRNSTAQIAKIIRQGGGRMPSFPAIQGNELEALLEYLRTGKDSGNASIGGSDAALRASANVSEKASAAEKGEAMMPYSITGYTRFDDPDGYPAIAPPWGTLNAIDLNTGKYLWKLPLGEYPELAAQGIKNTGTENYGGPIVTAGGLLVIAATNFDKKVRAFNSHTGELLWEAELPFAGVATPATYMVDGKQYIVIATCGARDPKSPPGAVYVAFALP